MYYMYIGRQHSAAFKSEGLRPVLGIQKLPLLLTKLYVTLEKLLIHSHLSFIIYKSDWNDAYEIACGEN